MTLLGALAVVPLLLSVPVTWTAINIKYYIVRFSIDEEVADAHFARSMDNIRYLGEDIERKCQEIERKRQLEEDIKRKSK